VSGIYNSRRECLLRGTNCVYFKLISFLKELSRSPCKRCRWKSPNLPANCLSLKSNIMALWKNEFACL